MYYTVDSGLTITFTTRYYLAAVLRATLNGCNYPKQQQEDTTKFAVLARCYATGVTRNLGAPGKYPVEPSLHLTPSSSRPSPSPYNGYEVWGRYSSPAGPGGARPPNAFLCNSQLQICKSVKSFTHVHDETPIQHKQLCIVNCLRYLGNQKVGKVIFELFCLELGGSLLRRTVDSRARRVHRLLVSGVAGNFRQGVRQSVAFPGLRPPRPRWR